MQGSTMAVSSMWPPSMAVPASEFFMVSNASARIWIFPSWLPEDMDFSLLAPDDKFDFTKYFQPIIDEFAIVGREVEIKKKDTKSFRKWQQNSVVSFFYIWVLLPKIMINCFIIKLNWG